jgi:hypothetical protein
MYYIILKNVFTHQEMIWDFLQAWLAESCDDIVENISSKYYHIYHEAEEHMLNLPCNQHSPSGASSPHSKPQNEANTISLLNIIEAMTKKIVSSSSYNSATKDCNWYCKHLPGTGSGHI